MGAGSVIPNGDATNGDIGRLKILNRLFNLSSSAVIDKFKVGIGTTTPAGADTDLETGVGENTYNIVTGFPTLNKSAAKITIRGQLSSGDANGNTLTEISWADGDGNILSREVHTGISKTINDEIAYVGVIRVVDET